MFYWKVSCLNFLIHKACFTALYFGQCLKSYNRSGKFVGAKIKSRDWTILRNNLTGTIVGRAIKSYFHVIEPNGRCMAVVYELSQNYNGSNYSKVVKKRYPGWAGSESMDIDCK